MLLIQILSTFIVAIASAGTVPTEEKVNWDVQHHHRRHHHHHHHHHHRHEIVKLPANQGWYEFDFGGKELSSARQKFHIHTKDYTYLTVTDCFCSGDAFVIRDGHHRLAPVDYGCQIGNGDCAYYSKQPGFCLEYEGWCSGGTYLAPGHHNITIEVLASPYGKGHGFVRLDSVCQYNGYVDLCCFATSNCPQKVHN